MRGFVLGALGAEDLPGYSVSAAMELWFVAYSQHAARREITCQSSSKHLPLSLAEVFRDDKPLIP
jgi:hypothetical protein